MSGLEALRCRDEILQAMYWMRGENLHPEADAATLERFLAIDRPLLEAQLASLRRSGHVDESRGGYVLTELGVAEGGRRFADEFGDLQRTAHAECPPNCPHCEPAHRGDDCSHCAQVGAGSSGW
jgi:hypothetical protein